MHEGVLLFLISVMVVTYVLLALIKKFIQSRPPGRRLVTSDIQCTQLNAKYLVLLSVAIPLATRAIIGPLTFYPTFVATEAFKVTSSIYFGLSNFSAALQLLFIIDFSFASSLKDTSVIAASYIFVAFLFCLVNVREWILMSLGHIPLLTRGIFALSYGGENIINKLSLGSPALGTHMLVLTSMLFQIFLYTIKKFRIRSKEENYMNHLQSSIVENVINIYNILFVAAVSLGSAVFGLYHAWRISRNSQECAEKLDTSILPPGIFVLFAVLVFSALKPYLTSCALRTFVMKKLTCKKSSQPLLSSHASTSSSRRRVAKTQVHQTGRQEMPQGSNTDELEEGRRMYGLLRYLDEDDRSFKTCPPIV